MNADVAAYVRVDNMKVNGLEYLVQEVNSKIATMVTNYDGEFNESKKGIIKVNISRGTFEDIKPVLENLTLKK